MSQKRLPPSLAKIAAMYDDIYFAFSNGTLDQEGAMNKLNDLYARDDQGVLWHIGVDGAWYCQNFQGDWVPGEPPEYGMPVISAKDVSNNTNAFNPDSFVHNDPVYQPNTAHPDVNDMAGSTWTPPPPPQTKSLKDYLDVSKYLSVLPDPVKNVVMALGIALAVVLLYNMITGLIS